MEFLSRGILILLVDDRERLPGFPLDLRCLPPAPPSTARSVVILRVHLTGNNAALSDVADTGMEDANGSVARIDVPMPFYRDGRHLDRHADKG